MNCINCNSEISKNKKFCNRSCSTIHKNKNRVVSDDTKKKISSALKGRTSTHPQSVKILEDYSNGMFMKDICIKYKIGNRRLRNMLKSNSIYKTPISNNNRYCKIHNTEYASSPSGVYRCNKCDVERVTQARKELKIKAVEYKGGKCEVCGYSKSMSALEFHHTDPNIKEKNIARYSTRQWEKVANELDKCILVCANCHREIHDEIRNNS